MEYVFHTYFIRIFVYGCFSHKIAMSDLMKEHWGLENILITLVGSHKSWGPAVAQQYMVVSSPRDWKNEVPQVNHPFLISSRPLVPGPTKTIDTNYTKSPSREGLISLPTPCK